jgi:hypothetical protein
VIPNYFCKTKACYMLHTLLNAIRGNILIHAIRGNILRQIGCFLFVSICLPLVLHAQSHSLTVSGKVTDSKKNPLLGVSVIIRGTTRGTATTRTVGISLPMFLKTASWYSAIRVSSPKKFR